MPKKTLALISGLVIVTIVLFVVALRAGQQQQAPSVPQTPVTQQQKPPIPAHTVLMLDPNPLTVAPGQVGTASITMDTSDNNVTAVQLELGYDPNIVSNLKVTPGPLFANPVVLINKNNQSAGRYTYAFGITPNSQVVTGKGVVATVSFVVNASSTGKQTQIGLLPTTLVTARGVAESVLKSATGTVVSVKAGASAAGTQSGSNGAMIRTTNGGAPIKTY